MKPILLHIIFLLIGIPSLFGQRCIADKPFHDILRSQDLETFTQKWNSGTLAKSRSKVIIPVVVHVVYRTAEENISEEQIHTQIAVLNQDFQRLNPDTSIVPIAFKDRIGKVGFEFCLAKRDENGNLTNGITRTQTRFENVGAVNLEEPLIYYTERGGEDAWDTNKYLNIWVADMPDAPIGFGSRPGQSKPEEDGVVIDYRYFGTIGTVAVPNHKGRTATHEIGHYFNLQHIHGDDNNDCSVDDKVADTPFQIENYFDCPTTVDSTCGSLDMTVNFMNWVNDTCMAMFTEGQVERMQAALYGAREALIKDTSTATSNPTISNNTIAIYPNPASEYLIIEADKLKAAIPYSIIDNTGRVVLTGEISANNTTLPMDSFLKGVYWIQFFFEDTYLIKKLVLI